MRRQEAQSTRKTSLGSLDPIEKAVVAKFRANLSDHIADSTKHITWGIPLPYGAKLWHFDGSLISTDGTAPVGTPVATLRPGEGRFGGAVAVEEETENLWKADTQWIGYQLGTDLYDHPVPTVILDNLGSYITVSYEARVRSGPNVSMQVYVRTTDGVINTYNKNPQLVEVGPEWTRVEQSVQIDGRSVDRYVWLARNPVGQVIDIRRFQVEAKPFATSFVDGTRAGGRLSYPKSLIAGLNALTVAAWTSGPPYWASEYRYLVVAQTSGTSPYGDLFALRQTEGNRISLWVRNDANSSAAEVAYYNVWDGNWHLIVGVINKSPQPGRQPIELYVDGKLVASSSNVNAVPDLSNINETWGVQVGHWRGSLQWNGLIDELLILPFAATPEQIQAWYAMGAPFWDPWVGQR